LKTFIPFVKKEFMKKSKKKNPEKKVFQENFISSAKASLKEKKTFWLSVPS